MPKTHLIDPGKKVDIAELPTRADDFCDDRKKAEREFEQLREQLVSLQLRLYAEGKQKLLIVLQAMDAGGKDGCTRKVFTGVNPQGVRIASFKAPSKRELSRDYLWRIHREVPAAGKIVIFNRSHYEDVLVVRVDKIVPKSIWSARFEQINNFEKLLAETGTRIIKFFLNISRGEQAERFQDRLDEPQKHWKFSRDDLRKREQWDDYMKAYEDVLSRCSTKHAPWYAIPADQKWYRNLAVARAIVDTLKDMDPQFPTSEDALDDVVIPE